MEAENRSNSVEVAAVSPALVRDTLAVLAESMNLSKAVIETLMQKFMQSSERELGKFREAIAQKDFEAMMHAAHSIKGAAATLRFDVLARMAAEAEEQAAHCAVCDYEAAAQRIEDYCEAIKRAYAAL